LACPFLSFQSCFPSFLVHVVFLCDSLNFLTSFLIVVQNLARAVTVSGNGDVSYFFAKRQCYKFVFVNPCTVLICMCVFAVFRVCRCLDRPVKVTRLNLFVRVKLLELREMWYVLPFAIFSVFCLWYANTLSVTQIRSEALFRLSK